jgi:hypothetical protein
VGRAVSFSVEAAEKAGEHHRKMLEGFSTASLCVSLNNEVARYEVLDMAGGWARDGAVKTASSGNSVCSLQSMITLLRSRSEMGHRA